MIQIPKQIFLIWLGDKLPSYINYVIQTYKKVNEDFDIIFLHYTINKIKNIFYNKVFENKYDELLYNSIYIIFNNDKAYHDHLYRFMINNNLKLYGKDLRFIQVLSDIYRLELLNYFGGIYVDCDTFPIRKFDYELLSKGYFIVTKHINCRSEKYNDPDNYFIGSSAGYKKITKNNNDFTYKLLQTTPNWWYNINFLKQKKRFFDLKMKFGEWSLDPSFYIEHYCDANWKDLPIKGIRTPFTFLDYEYKKIKNDNKRILQ